MRRRTHSQQITHKNSEVYEIFIENSFRVAGRRMHSRLLRGGRAGRHRIQCEQPGDHRRRRRWYGASAYRVRRSLDRKYRRAMDRCFSDQRHGVYRLPGPDRHDAAGRRHSRGSHPFHDRQRGRTDRRARYPDRLRKDDRSFRNRSVAAELWRVRETHIRCGADCQCRFQNRHPQGCPMDERVGL